MKMPSDSNRVLGMEHKPLLPYRNLEYIGFTMELNSTYYD